MTGLEALQSVQFITIKDKQFAVISREDWEALIDWLETVEDLQVAQQARAALQAANGDRAGAGWLTWDEVKGNLG